MMMPGRKMTQAPKTLSKNFTEGNVGKQLFVFAAPLFLSNLLQVVYNLVDMIIVGKAMGQVGLSAVSVGGDISNLFTFWSMGLANAGQVIISQYIGAKKNQQVGQFIGTMTTFLLSIAVALTILGLLFRNELLWLMHTPAECYDEALAYAATCMAGLVFIYGYNIVGGILRGMGDSKHPFYFISIAALLNIFLDMLFVFKFNWGAFGAALATVISQGFSFLFAVHFLYLNRYKLGFELDRSCFGINQEMLMQLLRLGLPMAIKQSSVQFSKLFINSWINSFGVTVSAVAGIGNKLNTVSNLISNSLNTAGASMVGQNIGAGKFKRVPKIILWVFAVTLSMSLILSSLMYFYPEQIFLLFTDDRSIIKVAMEFVPVAYLIFLGSACRAPMNALINGSGNYKVNFAVAMLDGIILRIGLAMLFGVYMGKGYLGFWYGDAFAGFTPLWVGAIYYYTGAWKKSIVQ